MDRKARTPEDTKIMVDGIAKIADFLRTGSLAQLQAVHVQRENVWQQELKRAQAKHGAESPKALKLQAQMAVAQKWQRDLQAGMAGKKAGK